MKMILKRILMLLAALVVVMVGILAIWTGVDSIAVHRMKGKALGIQSGDTLDSVIDILGQPNSTFAKGSGLFTASKHRELAYGSTFEWKNAFGLEPPFFFPFKFRLFGPYSDDIVIALDDSDIVLSVEVPKEP